MILLIDNYDSFTYNLHQQLRETHTPVDVVRNDAITIDKIKKIKPQGIVISPGPGRPENAGICLALIKQCYRDLPILGICLGHQAIAMAFGCKIIQANTICHGKSSTLFRQDSPIFNNTPPEFNVGRYHSLTVERPSIKAPLHSIAKTKDDTVMAIAHQKLPVFGLQFHPESILSEFGQQCINNFSQLCQEKSHAQ